MKSSGHGSLFIRSVFVLLCAGWLGDRGWSGETTNKTQNQWLRQRFIGGTYVQEAVDWAKQLYWEYLQQAFGNIPATTSTKDLDMPNNMFCKTEDVNFIFLGLNNWGIQLAEHN